MPHKRVSLSLLNTLFIVILTLLIIIKINQWTNIKKIGKIVLQMQIPSCSISWEFFNEIYGYIGRDWLWGIGSWDYGGLEGPDLSSVGWRTNGIVLIQTRRPRNQEHQSLRTEKVDIPAQPQRKFTLSQPSCSIPWSGSWPLALGGSIINLPFQC